MVRCPEQFALALLLHSNPCSENDCNPPQTYLAIGKTPVGPPLRLYHNLLSLSDTIHRNSLMEYLADKWELDELLLKERVCWTSIARARKQASFAQRKFITKWISGDTPSGVEMQRCQQHESSLCPICADTDETLFRILTCHATESTDLRSSLLMELQDWLVAESTCAWIQDFLIQGLGSWFSDPWEMNLQDSGILLSSLSLRTNCLSDGTPHFWDSSTNLLCNCNTAITCQKAPERQVSHGQRR